MSGSLDPYSRFSIEQQHAPTEMVQELLAVTASLDNAVIAKVTQDSSGHVSIYPPEKFPITGESAGILAAEPIFRISQAYQGDRDEEIAEIPEILSSLNLVNLVHLLNFGDNQAHVKLVRDLVTASLSNLPLARQLARILQSAIIWLGVFRSKDLGPNADPSSRAADSVGTVAVAAKIGLKYVRNTIPIGTLIEFYVPHVIEVLENQVWNEIPRLPKNLAGKVTLWARPWDPAERGAIVVDFVQQSKGVSQFEKARDDPAMKKVCEADPDTAASTKLIDCMNGQFNAGFLSGYRYFAKAVERRVSHAAGLVDLRGVGNFPIRGALDNNTVAGYALELAGLEGVEKNAERRFLFLSTARGLVEQALTGHAGFDGAFTDAIWAEMGEAATTPVTLNDILIGRPPGEGMVETPVYNALALAGVAPETMVTGVKKAAAAYLHHEVVWTRYTAGVPD
ncbi:MAG: hypothetical protein ACTSX8_05275, partial [Alphaproteobacteria bacterium]